MKKKTIIIILIITTLLAGLIYFAINSNLFSQFYAIENEGSNNKTSTDAATFLIEPYVFVGDNGYVLKGKLLNAEFEREFNKLPDTLYTLEFDDKLYAVNPSDDREKTRYSLIDDNTIKNINNYQGTHEQGLLISYLRLAIKGAAEYPIFLSSQNRYDALITNEEFNNTYKNYFGESVSNYGVSALPYDVKQGLIAFYESDEGKNYRYKIKGQQTSIDLIWKGELTGKGKKEVAILLNNKTSSLEDYYILLVYATKNHPYEKNIEYYLVYNETFYDRVLLGHLKTSSDGEDFVRPIYMGKENKVETEFDGIVLKQINQPDEVLVYNQAFDKLVKYTQLPPSKQNRSGEEDEESEEVLE